MQVSKFLLLRGSIQEARHPRVLSCRIYCHQDIIIWKYLESKWIFRLSLL